MDALLEAARTVLKREPVEALEYGGAQGFLRLRELIAERLGPAALSVAEEDLDALKARLAELGVTLA